MGHEHGHAGHGVSREADRRRLLLVLAITSSILVVELVGAWLAGSLALLADAGHMATDAASLVLALGASYMASRPAGRRSTFGWHRAEILAALVNAAVLLGVCAFLAYAGIQRLADPPDVQEGALIGFGAVAMLANAISLLIINRGDTDNLNLRGAATEVLADLLGSVLAVAAGLTIALTGWNRADPVASLLIAVLILPRSLRLLRDSAVVLLELAPIDLDLEDIERRLCSQPGVLDVHDLHAWTITSGLHSLSAHVRVDEATLEREGVGAVLDRLVGCARADFDLDHVTFQIEPPQHMDHEDLGETH
jgi:cobalt-zinc-cadmium efflux system protein